MPCIHPEYTYIQCGGKHLTREINSQSTIYILRIEIVGENQHIIYFSTHYSICVFTKQKATKIVNWNIKK